jgi:RimJ/RimL family protein N-acetyltransferase
VIGLRRRRGPPVRLETARFILKTLQRRELARISLPWTLDPEVMEPLEYAAGGWTLRRWEKALLKSNNRDRFCFGIEARESGAVIGYDTVQISRTNVAFMGVAIGDHKWWGRGTVLETRSALLDFIFDDKQCARVWAIVYSRNFPSIANYLALGFQHEGTLRSHTRLPNEARGDAMVFGICRSEWLNRRDQAPGS